MPFDRSSLIATTSGHLHDILTIAFEHKPPQNRVVVFDSQCELAQILTEGYRQAAPDATFIDFDLVSQAFILESLEKLQAKDLVVLIQSTSFRLEAFRIRVELFKRELKVIEHPHLSRMNGIETEIYIESLAYDPAYYRNVGKALKRQIDLASTASIVSGTASGQGLIFSGPFEDAKLNVGDYTGMKNIGGQFPIGEVFTETRDLEKVNGEVRIFAFADIDFSVNKPQAPITLVVSQGRISQTIDSTPQFDLVLEKIRADEGEVWIRELGFGMNRAFTHERIVTDVGTMERMCGIHLSLGAKHLVYRKPVAGLALTKHHCDVFVAAEKVLLDEKLIFINGDWVAD